MPYFFSPAGKWRTTGRWLMTLTFTCILSLPASGQTLIVGGYDYPPFMSSQNKTGLYHQLMDAIAAESGLTFDWHYYPYARLNRLFEQGSIHIEVGSSPIWTKASITPGHYSDGFYHIEDVALFATDKTLSVKNASDIHGRNIGVVRGYGFAKFDEAFHSGKAIRTDTKNELHLLEMLYHNRADAIFISRHVYYHHAIQNEKYQNFVIGDVIGAYEVGVRVHPSAKHILPLINRAIQTLKLNGTIRAIMSRDQPLSGIKKPAQ